MTRNLSAAPIPIDHALTMDAKDAQYRHVALTGRFDNSKGAFVYTTAKDGAPVYHVVTPFALDDAACFWLIADWCRSYCAIPTRAAGELDGNRTIAGIWRTPDAPGPFTPAPDLAHRVWYSRDLKSIAQADGIVSAEHRSSSKPMPRQTQAAGRKAGRPSSICRTIICNMRSRGLRSRPVSCSLSRLSSRTGTAGNSAINRCVTSVRAGNAAANFRRGAACGFGKRRGTFLPEAWPQIGAGEIASFASAPYAEVAYRILSRFVGARFSGGELKGDVDAAYASFEPLDTRLWSRSLPICFCSNSFTDRHSRSKTSRCRCWVASSPAHLAKRGDKADGVVAATSGDTGSAAMPRSAASRTSKYSSSIQKAG